LIALLRGNLFLKDLAGAVVDVGGVGYRVDMPVSSLLELPPIGDEVTLYVHTAVREDAIELFGFTSQADKRVFERLTAVSGIGNRLALNALSALPAADLVGAIVSGNLAILKSIKGIGKKTAERMVLELKDGFKNVDLGEAPTSQPGAERTANSQVRDIAIMMNDLRSGLANLGFNPQQVEATISTLREKASTMTIDELFKEALNTLRQ